VETFQNYHSVISSRHDGLGENEIAFFLSLQVLGLCIPTLAGKDGKLDNK
jgi:hypothetical protein